MEQFISIFKYRGKLLRFDIQIETRTMTEREIITN